jgi:hypothetical protein
LWTSGVVVQFKATSGMLVARLDMELSAAASSAPSSVFAVSTACLMASRLK